MYLGELCMYGNYTHGCLQGHQQGGKLNFSYKHAIVVTGLVKPSNELAKKLAHQEQIQTYPGDYSLSVHLDLTILSVYQVSFAQIIVAVLRIDNPGLLNRNLL
ncbi:hypothetical protein FGO68_gene15868 [Halteria grandinella]|uniref:Uncharacterized protein n=1 Tax=Halteria grandinella TaxID=5974 RepID=A0A8J8P9U5_HALGN|nr:hypothetical protein FGO68_gene15868 [Halteria grandinella]